VRLRAWTCLRAVPRTCCARLSLPAAALRFVDDHLFPIDRDASSCRGVQPTCYCRLFFFALRASFPHWLLVLPVPWSYCFRPSRGSLHSWPYVPCVNSACLGWNLVRATRSWLFVCLIPPYATVRLFCPFTCCWFVGLFQTWNLFGYGCVERGLVGSSSRFFGSFGHSPAVPTLDAHLAGNCDHTCIAPTPTTVLLLRRRSARYALLPFCFRC